jgi:hypothetical protein
MKAILLSFGFFLLTYSLSAQLAPACAGGSPATTCANACINCNFNGYNGSTAGYPSGVVPNFCGTVENAQWMGFIAGASNATFTVAASDCADGNGVQIALYEDCMGAPLACEKGEMDGANIPVSVAAQLTPGRNYFLLIDGFAGDQCDFAVSVSPANAVYEPPLGQIGQLTGPDKMCPGATMTFSVPPVFGAGAYVWSGPPGAMIDTMPLPVTVVGAGANQVRITLGDEGGQICVRAANSCNQTPDCGASLAIQLLDDSYRPTIVADTLQHLTCSGAPAELEVDVQSVAGFGFAWVADSMGHIVSGANFSQPTVDKTGTYTLTVTNPQNGCSTSLDIQVGPPDTPRVSDLRLRDITCYGFEDGEAVVSGVDGGREPYTYSIDGEAFVFEPIFRYLTPGQHTLALESADGCRADTTFDIAQPNEFIVDLGPDTSLHLGRVLPLWPASAVNEPERVAQLLIVPTELQAMLCDTCQYTPLHSFRYTVTALDSNGCKASDERQVAVTTERYVYVPNVFKPSSASDGNDLFGVVAGEDVEQVKMLRVVNRWGEIVHERANFAPNDPTATWDGKVSGQPAPPAVFVWQAQILFKDGDSEWRTGTVTLVR